MLKHGGRLNALAKQYNFEPESCLDLSTGINPNGWPVPSHFTDSIWSQLPQDDDGLIAAAQHYYQTESLLAVSGSQAAIQTLPSLRSHSKVGVLSPAYAEHHHAWDTAGHDIIELEVEQIDEQITQLDVLIIINPNNPTGHRFSPEQLLSWHKTLAAKGGWLIVDEAFIDSDPQQSLAQHSPQKGLIILRSIGKFFGLAGLRVGFVLAEKTLLRQLEEKLGPWPIASISRYVAQQALSDMQWQKLTSHNLSIQGERLNSLLTQAGLKPIGSCNLFQWVLTPHASSIHQQLAQQGIFTRLFTKPSSLRFGLAKTEADWQRLHTALQGLKPE